ncbi:MAG: nucleoside phosphorylase [Saprospiraceae bacterium]|nr:nucleoside phosphorylase [Saprospiraceae bacterium]
MSIKSSELILNNDGSIYHLSLLPNQVAEDIIFVGDQDRVSMITKYFDKIEFTIQHREFKTQTGTFNEKRITVISTGIGTDNIDIVLSELDALFNIDLEKREIKDKLTSLNIYRIGTSGALTDSVPVNSFVASSFAIGLDGLLHFYNYEENEAESDIRKQAIELLISDLPDVRPYVAQCSDKLLGKFLSECRPGITVTNTGFYGPQGRTLRINPKSVSFLDNLRKVQYQGTTTTNLEMETAGIYGLSKIYGHHAISLNAIIANRATGEFVKDMQKPVEKLIELTLETITSND